MPCVQGLEMVKLGGARGRNVHEIDFLVINFTYQYILNIEVKKCIHAANKSHLQQDPKYSNLIYKK